MKIFQSLKKLAMPFVLALAFVSVLFGTISAQEGVPQNVPAAAALYQVSQSVLFPVVDTQSGVVIGWKIESPSPVTVVFPVGACADVVSSTTTLAGTGTVVTSKLEDWKRVQATGLVTMTGKAATVYQGLCGPIVELTATVNSGIVLNVRNGPSTATVVQGKLQGGAVVFVQARNSSGDWVYAITGARMGGWLKVTYITVNGDVMSLPVANVLSPIPAPALIPAPEG